MRTLVGDGSYAWPEGPWLRANMVTTVDGSAQGADGRSGTINNAVDKEIFHRLRDTADAILVGAGTARAEGYGPAATPIVVVSRSGALPETMADAPEGSVRLAHGGDTDDLRRTIAGLHAEGFHHIVCEGGPRLLGDLLRAGLVDELCSTVVPCLIAGEGRRMVVGDQLDVGLELAALIEADGTLLARWLVRK
ncbi:dihydrofolate reductase family protein [Nocardioides sp. DS6]|uniref:Dihydrofolate reductase family protein n=1 Tax=Nocardioides eburneus TaxID=3231482 RepID=A0ABV3SYS7_9ACTN